MIKWEYKRIKLAVSSWAGLKIDEEELDSLMNDLGSQGWELVVGLDTNDSDGQTRDVVMVFKRQTQ